jgi:hypothetical protein
MTKKLLFVTTILLALTFTAFAADVSGKWVYEQPGRGGGNPSKITLTLKQDGAKLTGNESRPGRDGNAMETEISDGKVDGSNISFKVTRNFNGNSFVSDFTGTVSGDEIKLKITRQGQNGPQTTEVTAKKATT